jgi:hypothetical protein
MNRKKVILKPIQVTVSDSDREFLNTVLASNKSPLTKNIAVREIVGGYCSSCGPIATYKAILLNAHGATLEEIL